MSRPLTLLESAEVIGHMRFVELGAFERLGHRARQVASAPLATWLSGAALAHAYRASLLEDHLPVSAGLPGAGELTTSPGEHVDAALGLLGPAPDQAEPLASPAEAPAAPSARGRDEAELLVGLTDALYPAMLAGYEARLALASPASDPPLRRTLRRVVFDLSCVLEAGRDLRAGSPGLPQEAPPSARQLARSLADHLARGGPFGPIEHDC